jgi:hypothetical protein
VLTLCIPADALRLGGWAGVSELLGSGVLRRTIPDLKDVILGVYPRSIVTSIECRLVLGTTESSTCTSCEETL